jgi:DNA repair exonuclease SbcCD ATPase subunit
MTMKTGFGNRLAVLAVVVTMALATRAVWAQKAQQKAGEDIQGFRTGMVAIRAQIDTTLEALNGVVQSANGGDPKSAFKKYSDQIKNMDKQIQKTRSYRQKMQEQGQAYFKEWEAKMGAVTNEELKAKATARRAELQAQYEKISASVAQAKDDSAKFWQDLQDLQKYYASDLSPAGISQTAEMVAKASADGKTIQGYIDQAVAAVDKVMTEMGVEVKS